MAGLGSLQASGEEDSGELLRNHLNLEYVSSVSCFWAKNTQWKTYHIRPPELPLGTAEHITRLHSLPPFPRLSHQPSRNSGPIT